MKRYDVLLKVAQVSGCPMYTPDEELTFAYPKLTTTALRGVCAHLAHAFHPPCFALHLGASLEETGMLEGNLAVCPGCKGTARAHFKVTLKKTKQPTLTGVLTQKDKDVQFIIDHLKRIPLFKPLPLQSIKKLIGRLELKRFEDRTDIILQGSHGKFLFIIIKGEVEVLQKGKDGRESLLATLRKGECFGEMSLISGEPASATVKADGVVSLLVISKENFDSIIRENNSLNIYFNQLLTQRLRRQNVKIEEELAKGVLGKLSMISLPELSQTLNMNSRTGTLILYSGNSRGEVYFDSGNIIDVLLDNTTGEEAFYALLAWPEGDFRFKPGDPGKERKILMDTMGLLMEGLRRLDEKEKVPAEAAG
jgi:CRP-like cAMP-binding protein